MHVPSEDELAAIAAAYVAVTSRDVADAPPEVSRWRLAARLADAGEDAVRFAARAPSRWNAAGRLDA